MWEFFYLYRTLNLKKLTEIQESHNLEIKLNLEFQVNAFSKNILWFNCMFGVIVFSNVHI